MFSSSRSKNSLDGNREIIQFERASGKELRLLLPRPSTFPQASQLIIVSLTASLWRCGRSPKKGSLGNTAVERIRTGKVSNRADNNMKIQFYSQGPANVPQTHLNLQ